MSAVAGALDNAPVTHGDGGGGEVASQHPKPREDTILVQAGKPEVADCARAQDHRKLSKLHTSPVCLSETSIVGARPQPINRSRRRNLRNELTAYRAAPNKFSISPAGTGLLK